MAFNEVARLEDETHLRHGTIPMVALGGCHGALHLVRCQHAMKNHHRTMISPPTHEQSPCPCVVLDKVARLEQGETHLRCGVIAVAATGGCHGVLHLIRCQRTIKNSSQGRTFRTNPHALSILAQFWTKWQG
jgi:hypothetical protein